jgi:hypothetical protein
MKNNSLVFLIIRLIVINIKTLLAIFINYLSGIRYFLLGLLLIFFSLIALTNNLNLIIKPKAVSLPKPSDLILETQEVILTENQIGEQISSYQEMLKQNPNHVDLLINSLLLSYYSNNLEEFNKSLEALKETAPNHLIFP